MTSPNSSRKYHFVRSKSNGARQKIVDKLRPWRILAFALLFIATALFRSIRDHSDFEFLKTLLDDDVVPQQGGNLSSLSLSSTTKYNLAKDADLLIFYNLYIPQDSEGITNAINVIKDQMEQISLVLLRIEGSNDGRSKLDKRGVVLYNLIGNEDAFPTKEMANLCHKLHPRLECQLLQYYSDASEAVTLQDVHDFCHSDIAKDENQTRVVYLHSKGSYHSQNENHIWRRHMTDAVLHPDCLNPPDDRCDVCSAQFYIKYAIMFPGNMWTAKCSYIRRLIPPNKGEYERRKTESMKQFLMLRLWGVLQATLDTDTVEHFGLDRYQWEHWIVHPSIQPCEVHTMDVGPRILLGKDPEGRTFGPEYYDWGMGPRRIKVNLGGLRIPRLKLEESDELQFREYYYLPGNLLKWFHLYGSDGVPSQDSWVWRHFQAGQRWKELVGQYGVNAIDVMVENSNPRFHSAFATNHSEMVESHMKLFDEEDLSQSNPSVVVFYQISFPPDIHSNEKALDAVEAQFDALYMGQYDNVTNAFDQKQKVLLYYTISGGSSQKIDSVSNLCKEKSDRITCRQLGKYDTEGTCGEILNHLYTFCIAKPSFNVIHITNRLPGYTYKAMEKSFNVPKIQATTTAVMSKMCRPSEDACNVCGAEFYPLPFLHFTGNMFSASCGYVNNLLPPSTFEEQMNDIAGDALLAHLRGDYTTKLNPFNERTLGSYQHSVEHWIGSHPDLRPCDVAPMETDKLDEPILNQVKEYSLSLAPRRGSAPPGYLTNEEESKFRLKREVALREYYYLAGNVFCWHRLYEKVPDGSSWVWRWFPDGPLWETAVKTSGAADAVGLLWETAVKTGAYVALDELANPLISEEA